jgi:hypothetical protein
MGQGEHDQEFLQLSAFGFTIGEFVNVARIDLEADFAFRFHLADSFRALLRVVESIGCFDKSLSNGSHRGRFRQR